MKAVADTMIWISFSLKPGGFRYRLIRTARRQRVRLFVSDYILDELERTLVEDFDRSRRFAMLARRAVLRIARRVELPPLVPRHVPGDPNDDPIVQTALTAKADCLVTADAEILKLGRLRGLEILSPEDFALRLGMST